MNDVEWQTRVDTAALYRLIALEGWDDLIGTHVSSRIPGDEHRFLLNPYGMLFEEITASSLLTIDSEREPANDLVITSSITPGLPSTAQST